MEGALLLLTSDGGEFYVTNVRFSSEFQIGYKDNIFLSFTLKQFFNARDSILSPSNAITQNIF